MPIEKLPIVVLLTIVIEEIAPRRLKSGNGDKLDRARLCQRL